MVSVSEQELHAALFLLKDFLERDKKLANQGISLESVYHKTVAVHGALDTVVREQIAHGMRLDRYGKKIRDLSARVDAMGGSSNEFPEEMDTGSFRIDEVRKAHELLELQKKWETTELERKEMAREQRDSIRWWQRQRFLWVGIVAASVFAALLSGCVAIGIWWITHAK